MEYLNSYSYFLMDIVLEKADYEWDFKKGIEIDHRTKEVLFKSFKKSDNKKHWLKRLLNKLKGKKLKTKHAIMMVSIPLLVNIGISEAEILDTTKSIDKEVADSIAFEMEKHIDTAAYTEHYTQDPGNMEISEEGIQHIKNEEKLRNKAYAIGDGHITIGYGHATPEKKSQYNVGDKITDMEALKLLEVDLKIASRGVNRIFKHWADEGVHIELTQNQFDVLVSMAFNMGVQGLRNTEVISLIKQGKMKEAAEKIKNTGLEDDFDGLVKRRKSESSRFLT